MVVGIGHSTNVDIIVDDKNMMIWWDRTDVMVMIIDDWRFAIKLYIDSEFLWAHSCPSQVWLRSMPQRLSPDEIHLFVHFHHPSTQQLQELQALNGGDGHVLSHAPSGVTFFPEKLFRENMLRRWGKTKKPKW